MVQGLPTTRVVNVQASFAAIGAQAPNTSSVLIMTDENVIDTNQRIRPYASSDDVAADFGVTSYAYAASLIWFSYRPQPQQVYVGRWASTATSALINGGILTAAEENLTNFTTITNGGIDFTIDGTTVNLTGLDFSAQTNLNGVASVLNTALGIHGGCTWNGYNFQITSDSTGAGAAATGTVTLSGNPSAGDSVTIAGVAITFEASGATGNQVNIGATTADTTANLLGFLLNSTNATLEGFGYSRLGTIITITDKTVGVAGNSVTLTKSGTNITVSGATLTNGKAPSTITYATAGAGEDISTLIAMTQPLAGSIVQGANAESALQAVIALDDAPTYWFALNIATPTAQISDFTAVAAYIETTSHIQSVSTQDTSNMNSVSTASISYMLKAAGYERSFVSYNGSSPFSALGFDAIVCTVDYTQPNSTVTAALKVIPGITPDLLTTAQANALDANRCNYYATFNNGTAITQNGMMSGPAFIDEIVGIQALQNDLETDEYNMLITLPKVPQTDAGMHQLTGLNETTLDRYVKNGLLAPGTWTGPSFGALKYGDFLPKGYYIFRDTVALQATSDRAARKAVPAQIAAKLAGAVHKDNLLIQVNR